MRRPLRRRLAITAAVLTAAFAAITVVVHIPQVQYLMGWTHPDGTRACPFGHGATQQVAAPVPRAEGPALGFALGVTKDADILTWSARNSVSCRKLQRQPTLECVDVAASLVGDPAESVGLATVWFDLQGGVVRSIRTVRRTPHATRIARAFVAAEQILTRQLGAPTSSSGSAHEDVLSNGMLRQASREFRAPRYRAVMRATNMGDGYALTESFTAL